MSKLDGRVEFYQLSDLGVLLAGTEKSLYAIDAESGSILWKRKLARLSEGDVLSVPGTDIVLVSIRDGNRERVEALDVFTADTIWKTERVRGSIMQMVIAPESKIVATIFVRDSRAKSSERLKRKLRIHVFDLESGNELWNRELESDIELMPSRWDRDDKVDFTLDNYHPPLILDDRLYLFYDGVTSLDLRTGKERERQKFRVNEEGLALTEADALIGDKFVYTSGRGRVRAVSRANHDTVWEAKDLGVTPEMFLLRNVLIVRTGGRFSKLKDGTVENKGPFGVTAINSSTGKTLWRFKGGDKGITNLAIPNETTILLADRDDLIALDSMTGKRVFKVDHRVKDAAFLLLNERGEAIVGGQEEIAAFDQIRGRERWRARHPPPGRGVIRTIASVAARAASLYFRFGAPALMAYRGVQFAQAASSIRWSGLAARGSVRDVAFLASRSSRPSSVSPISLFGAARRLRVSNPYELARRPRVTRDVEERLFDRLDPASQLSKLSRFLWHRERMASLRGNWMYFYTDLKNIDGNGLAGVNVNTGATDRAIRLNDPDDRFITDEVNGLLFYAKDNRLIAVQLSR